MTTSCFAPVTDRDLAQARRDPAFRQRLLEQNLKTLLDGLKMLHHAGNLGGDARQLREGVELAVRLAELIQGDGAARTRRLP